jgi:hypothetical protein
MKTTLTTVWLLCSMMLGLPSFSWAQAQATAPPLSPSEIASLSSLNANDPSLLGQSAGERVVVVERGRYGPGFGVGLVILTAVIVTLIVVGTGPGYRRP